MKSFVIFDLDGTLLNTIADLGDACNYALRTLGYSEHALSTYNYMVGNGVRKLIERAEHDANAETLDKLLALFREYYDEHCTDHTTPYPGIPELLRALSEKGIAIAVATTFAVAIPVASAGSASGVPHGEVARSKIITFHNC